MLIPRAILLVFLFAVSLPAQFATLTYIDQTGNYTNGNWNGVEWLLANQPPSFGSTFVVQVPVSHVEPSCNCIGTHVLVVGFSNPRLDLGVGFLYSSIEYVTTMGIGTKGKSTFRRFGVPLARGLSGAKFYMQVALLRQGGLVQMSRGLEGVIGR